MARSDSELAFGDDPLVTGDTLKGLSAGENLDKFTGVVINDDFQVVEATDGGPGIGVVMFDVVAGQDATIALNDGGSELRVVGSDSGALGAPTAGDAVAYDGAGGFKSADANNDDEVWGVAEETASVGNLFQIITTTISGNVGDST